MLHRTARTTQLVAGADSGLPSPAAQRLRTSRWRDPRLWLGAALVLASTVVGARVLEAADDTVAVWALRGDLAAGVPVKPDDLTAVNVHFTDDADAARYVSADTPLPADLHLVRDVGAGELLAASALSDDRGAAPLQLPLSVAPGGMPADLAAGNRVDLWAVPVDRGNKRPVLVLREVTVVSAEPAGPAGAGSERQVLVTMPVDVDVAAVLSKLGGADATLIRAGG